MVKFDQPADKEKVITGGPWLIFDHCFAVSHWSPEFAYPDAKVNRTVVWVRFPGLNLVYYDESFLLAMASAIGRPIKVDTNTLKVERGKFARVCVKVDLTVPVVGTIAVATDTSDGTAPPHQPPPPPPINLSLHNNIPPPAMEKIISQNNMSCIQCQTPITVMC
jgi:hypothetical protein